MPEELQELLQERASLEQKMQALTGGTATADTEAGHRRYPITTMRARRAEDGAWMAKRDRRPERRAQTEDRVFDRPGADADPAPSTSRRDRRLEQSPIPDVADRTAEIRAVGRDLRALRDAAQDPPERTGQRILQKGTVPERSSLRQLAEAGRQVSGLSDEGGRLASRRLDRTSALRTLHNDPGQRNFAPHMPTPQEPQLRGLDERLSGARKRLDILQGGSGNLDRLRDVARQRLVDRRRETDRDAKRDAARLDRRNTGRPQE